MFVRATLLAIATLASLQARGIQRSGPERAFVIVQQELGRGEVLNPGTSVAIGWQADWSLLGPPGSTTPLCTLSLDDSGRAQAELELPAEASRRAVLWARVMTPGFQQWTRMTSLDPKQETQHLALPVRRGGTLYGVLREEPSAERGRAHLRLVRSGSQAADAELLAATADEQGRFHLHFRERGRYDLQASWKGRGIAVRRDLALDPLGDPEQVTLELGPGLAISGHVLDPDGVPVHPFTVSALPEGFPMQRTRPCGWNDDLYAERTVTDSNGRFELRGIAPGRYTLVGAFANRRPESLSAELVSAGTSDVTLEARVHRLLLRVLDHEERPVDLGSSIGTHPGRAGEAVLYCGNPRAPDESGLPGIAPPHFLNGREAIHVADPGDELLLAFAAPEFGLVEHSLSIPEQPWLVREDLRLPPPMDPPRLCLDVRAGGRPFLAPVELSLFSASGVDVSSLVEFQGGRLVAPVPCGAYSLRVRPKHWLFCWGGDPEELVPEYAPSEVPVELSAGHETPVEVTVHGNARLRLALELPPRGEEHEVRALVDREGDWRVPLREVLGGAGVELVPSLAGARIRPEFSVALPENAELRRVVVPWIAPGRDNISVSGLAPGAYRLVVELVDGRKLEQELELEEGRTTSITLAL